MSWGLSLDRLSSPQTATRRPLSTMESRDAYVCRLLPLTCLAPDIVEAILDGRQPKGLRLAEMLGNGPSAWKAQRERLGSAIDTSRSRDVLDRDHPLSRLRLTGSLQPTDLASHVVPDPEFERDVGKVWVNAFDAEGRRRNRTCEHCGVRR